MDDLTMRDNKKNIEEHTKDTKSETTRIKEIWSWAMIVFCSLIVAIFINSIIKPTLVSGDSMYPTLHNNDYLVLNRVAYLKDNPLRGDIVVFNSHLEGETTLIKRVIATEGEKIEVKNGQVYINDKLLSETYLKGVSTEGDLSTIVPKNKVFVMGDNRPNSLDSRRPEVGFIDKEEIIGKVWFQLF